MADSHVIAGKPPVICVAMWDLRIWGKTRHKEFFLQELQLADHFCGQLSQRTMLVVFTRYLLAVLVLLFLTVLREMSFSKIGRFFLAILPWHHPGLFGRVDTGRNSK